MKRINEVSEFLRSQAPGSFDVLSYAEEGMAYSDVDSMNHAFWINDLLFMVPPESITSQTEDTISTGRTLRSKSSSKIHTGKGNKVYTIAMTVPSKSAIVNVDYRTAEHTGSDNTGKRGGILDLIIQFKNTPFARVENGYIRSELEIPSNKNIAMCLHQLSVQTEPDSTDTLSVIMTMTLFNYSPFSTDFAYKEEWKAKGDFGGFDFEDINPIVFLSGANRVKYGEENRVSEDPNNSSPDQVQMSVIQQITNPIVRSDVNDERAPYHITDEDSRFFDYTVNSDQRFMEVPVKTMSPARSNVFKQYIDWLWTKWERLPIAKGETFDCTKISPYGTDKMSLGSEIKIKWNEYQRFELPVDVEREVVSYIRSQTDPLIAAVAAGQTNVMPRKSAAGTPPTSAGPMSVPPEAVPNFSPIPPNIEDYADAESYQEALEEYERLAAIAVANSQTATTSLGTVFRDGNGILNPSSPGRYFGAVRTTSGGSGEIRFTNAETSRVDPGSNNPPASEIQYATQASTHRFHEGLDIIPNANRDAGIYESVHSIFNGTIVGVSFYNRSLDRSSLPGEIIRNVTDASQANNVENNLLQGVYPISIEKTWANGQRETVYGFTKDGNAGYGVNIVVQCEDSNSEYNGQFVLYGHLAWPPAPGIEVGAPVRMGQEIGAMGATGTTSSSGIRNWPHVHIEISRAGVTRGQFMMGSRSQTEPTISWRLDPMVVLGLPGTNPWIPYIDNWYVSRGEIQGTYNTLNVPRSRSVFVSSGTGAAPTGSEALGIDPASIMARTMTELPKYRAWVEEYVKKGWIFYNEDITVLDTFYRPKEMSIFSDSSAVPQYSEPLVCSHISLSFRNSFRSIPINGSLVPSAQLLGKEDDSLIMYLASIGLNNLKEINSLWNLLRKQALMYKHIPGSWFVRIENPLINSGGTVNYLMNLVVSSTIEGVPDLYNIELHCTGNIYKEREYKLKYVRRGEPALIAETFIREYFSKAHRFLQIFDTRLTENSLEASLTNPIRTVGNRNARLMRWYIGTSDEVNAMDERNPLRIFTKRVARALNGANTLFLRPENNRDNYTLNTSLIPQDITSRSGTARSLNYFIDENGQSYIFRNLKRSGAFRTNRERNVSTTSDWDPTSPIITLWHGSEDGNSPVVNLSGVANNILDGFAFTIGNVITLGNTRALQDDVERSIVEHPGRNFRRRNANYENIDWSFGNIALLRQRIANGSTERLSGTDIAFSAREFALEADSETEQSFLRPYMRVSPGVAWYLYILESSKPVGTGDRSVIGGRNVNESGLPDYTLANGETRNASLAIRGRTTNPPEFLYSVRPLLNPIEYFNLGSVEDILSVNRIDQSDVEDGAIFRRHAQVYSYFERYLWEQVALPQLLAEFNQEAIANVYGYIENGENLFPITNRLIQNSLIEERGECYPDIILPLHPYWNNREQQVNSYFTEPDFYFYNSGYDGTEEAPLIEAEGMTEREAINRSIQINAEMTSLSFARMSEENQRNTIQAIMDTPNMYEGLSQAIHWDHPPHSKWAPVRTGDGPTSSISFEDDESPEDLAGKIVNHGYNGDTATRGSMDELTDDNVEGEVSDSSLETNVNRGMSEIGENRNQPTLLNWTELRIGMGPNLQFSSVPPELAINTFSGFSRSEYNNTSSQEMLTQLSSGANLTSFNRSLTYDFITDRLENEGSTFIDGNWGWEDEVNYSNTRLSVYRKVREAIRSLSSKKLMMKRAFPTFKVFFIDDDNSNSEWVEFDDTFTYNQVHSITVTDSRKRPASVCEIVFVNIGGILSGQNQYKMAQTYLEGEAENPLERYDNYLTRDRTSNSDLLKETEMEQNITSFILQEGVKIRVKMGYSNDSEKLDDVFFGEVIETEFLEEGHFVLVRAMSYGMELVARPKGATSTEISKTYPNTFNLLAHMMFQPEVMHFGRKKLNSVSVVGQDQSIQQNEIIHRNTIGRQYFWWAFELGYRGVLAVATQGTSEFLAGLYGGVRNTVIGTAVGDSMAGGGGISGYIDRSYRQTRLEPLVGPQDDNIYAPNYSAKQRMVWYKFLRFGTIEREETVPATETEPETRVISTESFQRFRPSELEYNIFYSTIWDIFTEMTWRHPGYVKHPRIYKGENRMTMFFGLPEQFYWASAPVAGEAEESARLYGIMEANSMSSGSGTFVKAEDYERWTSFIRKRLEPFRNWWGVTSSTDIVANNIIANKHGFYTAVSVQYATASWFGIGSGLRGALGRAQGLEDLIASGQISASSFVNYSDSKVEEAQAHYDLSPDNIRQTFIQIPNCRSRYMARIYANGILTQSAKEMYKGSLLLMGNPKIKPYDVILIADAYNDIFGPIEVEEVIHMFSHDTGFVTEIIPDAFVFASDVTPAIIMAAGKTVFTSKAERYFENAVFTGNIKGDNSFLVAARAEGRRRLRMGQTVDREAIEFLQDQQLTAIAASGAGGAVVGGLALATGAPGLLALGAAGLVAAASISTYYTITNYLISMNLHRRAFIMVPLMKSRRPWLAGYEMTMTNSATQTIFGTVKRWLEDGNQGNLLALQDTIARNRKIREIQGSSLTILSRFNLGADEVMSRTSLLLSELL